MTTHTNKNGINYYSMSVDGLTIYSFEIDFLDYWTQDDEDLHGE